jgi:hypothetical protein
MGSWYEIPSGPRGFPGRFSWALALLLAEGLYNIKNNANTDGCIGTGARVSKLLHRQQGFY